jgi:hypothetical protein
MIFRVMKRDKVISLYKQPLGYRLIWTLLERKQENKI